MTELEQLLQQAEETFAALMKKNEQERIFAVKSRQCFEKNILAFEKYYPDIAKTIKEYTPNADFEILVTRSGAGNFVPKRIGVPIYSSDH